VINDDHRRTKEIKTDEYRVALTPRALVS